MRGLRTTKFFPITHTLLRQSLFAGELFPPVGN
jgi:hypothetical protein